MSSQSLHRREIDPAKATRRIGCSEGRKEEASVSNSELGQLQTLAYKSRQRASTLEQFHRVGAASM